MKKWLIALLVFLVVIVLLLAGVYAVFFKKSVHRNQIFIENPMKKIVEANMDASGKINEQAVIEQGVREFNINYINYILLALGVGDLRKSLIGYGNPVVELALDNEIWSSEIKDSTLYTGLGGNDNKDLRVTMSKEEAVRALLSPDIRQFMKDSVANGNTQIEMIAGNVELGSKGYLDMYQKLKG